MNSIRFVYNVAGNNAECGWRGLWLSFRMEEESVISLRKDIYRWFLEILEMVENCISGFQRGQLSPGVVLERGSDNTGNNWIPRKKGVGDTVIHSRTRPVVGLLQSNG